MMGTSLPPFSPCFLLMEGMWVQQLVLQQQFCSEMIMRVKTLCRRETKQRGPDHYINPQLPSPRLETPPTVMLGFLSL